MSVGLSLSVELRRARSRRISEHGVAAEDEQRACTVRHEMPPPVRVDGEQIRSLLLTVNGEALYRGAPECRSAQDLHP